MTLIGDFDIYLPMAALETVAADCDGVTATWSDGHIGRFHLVWLRDNCPCGMCVHTGTKEQMFELLDGPTDLTLVSSGVISASDMDLTWSDGHRTVIDGAWLRAHCYCDLCLANAASAPKLWTAAIMSEPPTFAWSSVSTLDHARYEWLSALRDFGATRVSGLPTTDEMVGELARLIGPVRDTNFGVLWDVWTEPDPVTNANTALLLPSHVDLPTREYQPGLQFLHCLENEAAGGMSTMVDGFAVANALREFDSEAYETLTTVPWNWANRSKTSDYRWASPMIVTDHAGAVTEVRVGNWLRAPLQTKAADVERAYTAYRAFATLTRSKEFRIEFRFEPGDCIAFDNRRILHGRTAFDDGDNGRRHLRGCYSERDELHSRLRVLERQQRAVEARL